MPKNSARDRLLLAGAQLLEQTEVGDVSTRAICELAGVQAPTLYHHFGSKQRLLDEVVSHGFRDFLATHAAEDASLDPLQAIRDGWDIHVRFGVEHPTFYAYIYARVSTGARCGVVSEVEEMLLKALEPAARQGLLTVTPTVAAAEILAASTGVIMTLITTPETERDPLLSGRVRDAIRAAVTVQHPREDGGRSVTPASAAVALLSVLDDADAVLSDTERALLRDWLGRLLIPKEEVNP
ncbi:TetR/AcrR family transcriptional regulator [Streptomyces griseoluteus]|uniref:TetR/AcrR family transcriptional regulator n=1 Tax=Streptomyces griseoluteus TaxID=29306 RepID=UPI0038095629